MLPLELVVVIADQLETDRDHFNLARTCKTIFEMLVSRPWNVINIEFCKEENLQSATKCRSIRDGAIKISTAWRRTRIRQQQCPMSPCEACEIEVALLPIKAYLESCAGMFSKDLRELCLRGCLPETLESMNEDAPGHILKGVPGLCALRPEILNIELRWANWSPIMLSSFDLTRVRSLKMPVRAPLDCLKIGAAFLDMPHLANLTITELSDSQDFVNEFRHLGDGIIALSASLRSLDIGITNCNRVEDWENDEAFVEPADAAFFFKSFFPEPTCYEIEALVRARYNDPREPLDANILRSSKGQLNLERIRLRHIGLPWWAFQTVFNPETIRVLDLPTCRIAPNVWDDLAKHAQLHKLANINYEMLSGPFVRFLSTQPRLHFLSLKRPPDIYSVAAIRPNIRDPSIDSTTFAVTEAPHLGPSTEWGRAYARESLLLQFRIQFEHLIRLPDPGDSLENLTRSLSSCVDSQHPKSLDFVNALSNKTWLKRLVLPADMFDITPSFLACLADVLPALESIELGFDYSCLKLRECFIKDFLPSQPHVKKITFLSLNRPRPLLDFEAIRMYAAFAIGPHDPAPASLKYIQFRDLNSNSHKGVFTKAYVYCHRETLACGNWWLELPASDGERMFDDEITPNIYTT